MYNAKQYGHDCGVLSLVNALHYAGLENLLPTAAAEARNVFLRFPCDAIQKKIAP